MRTMMNSLMKRSDTTHYEFDSEFSEDAVKLYENYDSSGCDIVSLSKHLNQDTSVENALTLAPSLSCPRAENDDIGDDMSEVSEPPGWSELTRDQQLDILDWQMDSYWDEHRLNTALPVNWWRFAATIMMMVNLLLLLNM